MTEPQRRAAVFTGHFLPNIGGVEVYTYRLWRRLAERGWKAVVITSDIGGGPLHEEMDGLRIVRLPSLPLRRAMFPLPTPSSTLRRVADELNAFAPAVVVTNLRFMPPCWLGAAYATRHRLPRVHIEHSSGTIRSEGRLTTAVSTVVDQSVGRWMVRSATRAVGVSAASAAFVRSLGARSAAILTAGVDPPTRADEARERWRQQLGLPSDAVVFLFVSRVVESKGIRVLLGSWRRVSKGRGHLVIAGDGEDLDQVRRQAGGANDVHVIGAIPQPEVAELMAASDVFVHPSLSAEGLPLTVLEAAAAGLAIVATPQGGTGEVVPSEREGILVRPGDVSDLTAAMERLLRDDATRRQLGRAVQQKVLNEYGWSRVLDKAEELFLGAQGVAWNPRDPSVAGAASPE